MKVLRLTLQWNRNIPMKKREYYNVSSSSSFHVSSCWISCSCWSFQRFVYAYLMEKGYEKTAEIFRNDTQISIPMPDLNGIRFSIFFSLYLFIFFSLSLIHYFLILIKNHLDSCPTSGIYSTIRITLELGKETNKLLLRISSPPPVMLVPRRIRL